MTCDHCGGDQVFRTRFFRDDRTGFPIEPNVGGFLTKQGLLPEVWVCPACRHVQFFIREEDLDKVLRV